MAQKKNKKTVKNSYAMITALMTPQDQNFLGYVFGGAILKLMDQIAYVSAARNSGKYCVTASFDRVDFKEHVHVGELLTLKSSVNIVGKTSMEVGVRIEAKDPKTGNVRHTASGYVTMVAIDKNGNPTKVPAITPETDDEKRRYREGQIRYKMRKEMVK